MSSPSRRHADRSLRHVVSTCAAVAGLVVLVSSCSGPNPFQASSATTVAPAAADGGTPPTSVVDNDFIPADKDLGDCIGTLQRPGCGSDARGGWRQYLTMGVLVLGLAFVGWRISRGVRARDAVVNAVADASDRPPTGCGGADA